MKWIAVCLAIAGLGTVSCAEPRCPPPMVSYTPGHCVCPTGTHASPAAPNVCVAICQPPKVVNAAGACVCPAGTHQSPLAVNVCVSNCPPPKKMDVTGKCVCPPGTHEAAAAAVCVKN